MHGGTTPSGPALPQYKHGRYSKVFPPAIRKRYQRARRDPDLLAMVDEIAALDARVIEMMGGLGSGIRSLDTLVWRELRELFDERRKLVESERKRMLELQQYMTAEQVIMLMRSLMDLIAEHVKDRDTLQAIVDGSVRLLEMDNG